jgi:hypothetical protein
MLELGTMNEEVRCVVARLVAKARPERPAADERLNGFLLTGGPGGCSYLDVEGRVWDWSAWDDSVELVPDGPRKVALVAIAAERVPELSAWLPARPSKASDCVPCHGAGWLPTPWPRLLCPECHGMGWVPSQGHTEPGAAIDAVRHGGL